MCAPNKIKEGKKAFTFSDHHNLPGYQAADMIGEPPMIIRFSEFSEYELQVNKFEEIKQRLLKTGKAVIQHAE